MPVGNPLLATIDASGTVRTMELVAGAFSQITSQGGFATPAYGPPVCPMGWADDQLVIIHCDRPSQKARILAENDRQR